MYIHGINTKMPTYIQWNYSIRQEFWIKRKDSLQFFHNERDMQKHVRMCNNMRKTCTDTIFSRTIDIFILIAVNIFIKLF